MNTIGQIIHIRRKKKGVSLAQMSVEIGVCYNTLQRWEKDIISPSLLNAITLADFFECTIDELVGRGEK